MKAHRWIPYALAALCCAVYTTYSLVRHARVETAGYDLGIFDQAVRSYAGLHAPIVSIKQPGFNLLGDHFHPILVLLVPLYWLWPSASALLFAQALLFAISIVPVTRLALRRLGTPYGVMVGLSYGLAWGLQSALAFDFHEVAFAVPLLAFAMVALAESRWRAAALWTLPLLLVKEDMGFIVCAVGGVLLLKRQWRLGAALIATGAAAMALVLFVAIPYFNPAGVYPYWGRLSGADSLLQMANEPGPKSVLLLTLLGATAFAAVRSPLLLVAVPNLLYRFMSPRPEYWGTGFVHYNAVLMPIVFVAFVDALGLLSAARCGLPRFYARAAVPAALIVALALSVQRPLLQLTDPDFYHLDAHMVAVRDVLRLIPSGASVSAGDYLAPQLSDRCDVVLFPNLYHAPVDWVVVDTTRMWVVPAPAPVQLQALQALPSQGFHLVAAQSGIVLYHRWPVQ